MAVDNGDTAWSVGAGFRFSRHLGAEVEYLDLGTTGYTEHYTFEPSSYVDSGVLTHKYMSSLTGVAVSLLGSLPLGKDFAQLLRGGAWFADRKVQVPLALGGGDITYGDTVWLAGAGVDWSLSKAWALRAEYRRAASDRRSPPAKPLPSASRWGAVQLLISRAAARGSRSPSG